jgi:hypothetical protein
LSRKAHQEQAVRGPPATMYVIIEKIAATTRISIKYRASYICIQRKQNEIDSLPSVTQELKNKTDAIANASIPALRDGAISAANFEL